MEVARVNSEIRDIEGDEGGWRRGPRGRMIEEIPHVGRELEAEGTFAGPRFEILDEVIAEPEEQRRGDEAWTREGRRAQAAVEERFLRQLEIEERWRRVADIDGQRRRRRQEFHALDWNPSPARLEADPLELQPPTEEPQEPQPELRMVQYVAPTIKENVLGDGTVVRDVVIKKFEQPNYSEGRTAARVSDQTHIGLAALLSPNTTERFGFNISPGVTGVLIALPFIGIYVVCQFLKKKARLELPVESDEAYPESDDEDDDNE